MGIERTIGACGLAALVVGLCSLAAPAAAAQAQPAAERPNVIVIMADDLGE